MRVLLVGGGAREHALALALRRNPLVELHAAMPHPNPGIRSLATSSSLVSADDVAVNCGKSSKLGSFEVNPSAGERRYDGASLDNEGRYSTWQPIPCGQPVTCYDFSSQGNLKSEVTFAVQEGQLGTGVWAVVQDDRGVFFFPVIYYRDRTEIIPDSVTVVREEKCKSFSSNASGEVVSLIGFDPSKLFGGQARVLPTRNKKK